MVLVGVPYIGCDVRGGYGVGGCDGQKYEVWCGVVGVMFREVGRGAGRCHCESGVWCW